MKLEDVDRAQFLAAQLRHIKLALERIGQQRHVFHGVKVGGDGPGSAIAGLAYLRVQGSDLVVALDLLQERTRGQLAAMGVELS